MTSAIAIVGMACRYPDAGGPEELWRNVLSQRRAFRAIPPSRLRLEDYWNSDPDDGDALYVRRAAVLEGYEFDRARFRVPLATYRSADMAHWLALEVAADALGDAGFPAGEDLPRAATGVVVGNSLTGDQSRASSLRLRWPFVERTVAGLLAEEGWPTERGRRFLERLEEAYKAPFAPVTDESLAGGLANTIAGRICGHFGLGGGGYTVDGACASSLLSIANACNALVAGQLDVALAGGVDLSLDPFELVGFSRLGALSPGEMAVYDRKSRGFLPGEGCGMFVLMRESDARAADRPIRALLRGWGISSDGSGGITRPEVAGQRLALRRAYEMAGYSMESVGYFEGHGTGTPVGDAVELEALSSELTRGEGSARQSAAGPVFGAALGSVKANIGHTKAAAGAAGLLKAVSALEHGVLPPTTGCREPHPLLTGRSAALRVLDAAEDWPQEQARRASVSSMGFGGINVHVTVEAPVRSVGASVGAGHGLCRTAPQGTELFLVDATSREELRDRLTVLRRSAAHCSEAELTDMAAELAAGAGTVAGRGPLRAAAVAERPSELVKRLTRMLARLETRTEEEAADRLEHGRGWWLGDAGDRAPRLGFLFPGQGSLAARGSRLWARRFPELAGWLEAGRPERGPGEIQPAIVGRSLAALDLADRLGLAADVAVGHSLGELCALHWAGCFDRAGALRIARARGRIMAEREGPRGGMASVSAPAAEAAELIAGLNLVVAAFNGPSQTVVSGPLAAIDRLVQRARRRDRTVTRLEVADAFHSPLMTSLRGPLEALLADEAMRPPARTAVSTVTGETVAADGSPRGLLLGQLEAPVRFQQAIERAEREGVDLWLELGPGSVLSRLAEACGSARAVSVNAGSDTLLGLLEAVATAWTLGAPVRTKGLFEGRFFKPFDFEREPVFLPSPCEAAAGAATRRPRAARRRSPAAPESEPPPRPAQLPTETSVGRGSLELVRGLVASELDLPAETLAEDQRLLEDLHLSSIRVTQVAMRAARELGLGDLTLPTDLATFSIAELAGFLDEVGATGVADLESGATPAGVGSWVRPFVVAFEERPLPVRRPARGPESTARERGRWRVVAPPDTEFAGDLQRALAASGRGSGTAVYLPEGPDSESLGLLLQAVREVEASGDDRLLIVQHRTLAASFARSFHLETEPTATCVVEIPESAEGALDWIVAEARSAEGFVHARYDRSGNRRVPVLRLAKDGIVAKTPVLGRDDVVVVSGGGKGIAAECALELGRRYGAALALLGRSDPGDDTELAANLDRLRSLGARFRYLPVDVCDPAGVTRALATAREDLGEITALLHGAGSNRPGLLSTLDLGAFAQALAPKVEGLRNLLAALDPERLRLVVAFGSLIARTGLAGESHYGLANEWMAACLEAFGRDHPACRTLTIDWSIWAGAGMGERLGTVESLARQGISPIGVDDGVRILNELLEGRCEVGGRCVVAGRMGDLPTLERETGRLPLRRFLEFPRLHYPGVELVVDAELAVETDPYLADHVVLGAPLVPAVLGLEAICQVAMAIQGADRPPVLEAVRFERALQVPEDGPLKVRIAGLRTAPEIIEVVVRSAATGFDVDHFRARCRFDRPEPAPQAPACTEEFLALDPGTDLYGGCLFQTGRFQRVTGYRQLSAHHSRAAIGADGAVAWFGRYLPAGLVLGDPAARDAAIHSVQASIPHATVLPVGVDRIETGSLPAEESWEVEATELRRDGDSLFYQLEIVGADGLVRERWHGLELRIAAPRAPETSWPAATLRPYLERRLEDLLSAPDLAVSVAPTESLDREGAKERALERLLGSGETLRYRPDGRPQLLLSDEGGGGGGRGGISIAHADGVTLAIRAADEVGCDLEPVVSRADEDWAEILSWERLDLAGRIADLCHEDLATARTRVWTALECLRKVGLPATAPLTLVRSEDDGWLALRSGTRALASYATSLRGGPAPLTFTFVHEEGAIDV